LKKKEINIVWLKRDLRTQDHEALWHAENSKEDYVILHLIEPSIIELKDTSLRHLQFCYHSILDMNQALSNYNRKVVICYGEALEVFKDFNKNYTIRSIFSYQESGIKLTWQRDKKVAKFLKDKKIIWQEFQRDGIIRGIKNRNGWDKSWFTTMHSKIIKNEFTKREKIKFKNPFLLTDKLLKNLKTYPKQFQPAGEKNAFKYLDSFVNERGKDYHRLISKPNESRKSCGRISPYIAWGNLSIRQAYQFIKYHPNIQFFGRAFNGILTRLKWHCHFIQKFEVECEYETDCINRGYELLERTNDKNLLEAWKNAETGFTMVDANMRCVIETGWINFRMRAMLVSVLCHHFDCDWRLGASFLAKQFLDYEPGIHYPQFQMQAGTTGINTIRMYNPIKQSYDHDLEGKFIKKWLPELKVVPQKFIQEPNKMTMMEQQIVGFELGKDYPKPIIDLVEAGKIARKKIWGHKKNEIVKQEKIRIVRTHTRNNSKI